MRAYQLKFMARRRAEWISANGPCIECGSWDELEVDHINPTEKMINPRGVWSLSKEKREAELAKCQVLCRNCHREKTRQQFAKLTWEQVREIRASEESDAKLALKYGVHKKNIYDIRQEKTWRESA